MFIVTVCANRGVNGLFTKKEVTWAESISVEKIDGNFSLFCFHESDQHGDKGNRFNIVYESKPNGNWEWFYVKDSRTGNIVLTPKDFY